MLDLYDSENTPLTPVSSEAGKGLTDDGTSDPSEPGLGRRVDIWDVASLFLLTSMMLAAVSLAPYLGQTTWFYRSRALTTLTLVTGLASLLALGAATRSERPRIATLPHRLTALWRNPPGTWPAFALGTIMSLPLLGLYTTRLGPDSDTMRLVTSIHHVQRGNLDFLVDTQDSFGPHLFLGPVLAVAGAAGARLFTILSMQLLVGAIAWVTYRLSRSMGAAAIAVLALLAIAPFMHRAIVLPMYPTMLLFVCLGTWLAYRVIAQEAGWAHALGAGFLLVLGYEAQPVGQLLLALPLLLLITAPTLRRGFAGVARVYIGVLLSLVPRIVVNVSNGEWAHIRSNRTDYWITEGYLRQIQGDFWGYAGLGESYPTYLMNFPERFVDSLGPLGWVGLVLAAVAVIGLRGRARWFSLAALGLVTAAMTMNTIQPNARYFSPLWPGVAMLAGIAGAELFRRRQFALRVLAAGLVLALLGGGLYNLRDTGITGRSSATAAERRGYTTATDIIDDGRGVIGVRSHLLNAADPDLRTYGGHLLSEEEFVTYLTWPSDEEVIEIMERHDIGWVMTTKQRRLDHAYHDTWLVPAYGVPARHLDMVRESPNFCRVNFEARVTLYNLGPCEDAD